MEGAAGASSTCHNLLTFTYCEGPACVVNVIAMKFRPLARKTKPEFLFGYFLFLRRFFVAFLVALFFLRLAISVTSFLMKRSLRVGPPVSTKKIARGRPYFSFRRVRV